MPTMMSALRVLNKVPKPLRNSGYPISKANSSVRYTNPTILLGLAGASLTNAARSASAHGGAALYRRTQQATLKPSCPLSAITRRVQ